MPDPILFQWPANAAFGRAVPKTRFYEHGTVSNAVRERFVDHLQRITWAYKLADDTIRLRGTTAVPEIQVFTVEAKGADVPDEVLTAIDKAVHYPIVFEVTGEAGVRTVAAQKSLDAASPKVGPYLTSSWAPVDSPRRPLPTALDLPTLYDALLMTLLLAPARAGESVSEVTDRLDRARRIQREISALERKLRTEPQLNRKIDLRRQLKEREAALAELTDLEPSNKE